MATENPGRRRMENDIAPPHLGVTHSRAVRWASLLALGIPLFACTALLGVDFDGRLAPTAPEGDAAVDIATACEAYARGICDRGVACGPFLLALTYGDYATCLSRVLLDCKPIFQAPGNRTTPEAVMACGRELAGTPCGDFVVRRLPAACVLAAGALVDGTPCGFDHQCASRRCRVRTGSRCGVCAVQSGVSGECNSDRDCQPGLRCREGTCEATVGFGSPCGGAAPCTYDLACIEGRCATPLDAGAACSPSSDRCANYQGYYCDPISSVCKPIPIRGPSEPCGNVASTFGLCRNSTLCVPDASSGTCQPLAVDGADCNEDGGPHCLIPARCAAGVCTLADPSRCN
jgi:hypothetical protein